MKRKTSYFSHVGVEFFIVKQACLYSEVLEKIPEDKFGLLAREDLLVLLRGEQKIRAYFEEEVKKLRALNEETKQKLLFVQESYVTVKNKIFARSSEKEPVKKERSKPKQPEKRVLLPSQRYPGIPVIEQHLELKDIPDCTCCGKKMLDSGMTEDSECLTRIPAKFTILRQKRHKYRCGSCHGDIQTTPAPARIKEGSSYSDEMILDVAMGKFCDLLPIERYVAIAARLGMENLPPQSLIDCTHHLASYVQVAYLKIMQEILQSKVLHADETPHRMLEGSDKKSWYLWGFSSKNSSYFEIRDTRSGDVASDLLVRSKCEYLMSDVFCGYTKSVRETNKIRKEQNLSIILNLFCNSHARRKFKVAEENFPDARFFIDRYKLIYQLDDPPDGGLPKRAEMKIPFQEMKERALASLGSYPKKSSMGKALRYFLKNYAGLTECLKDPLLPLDNNHQERLLRNHVVGRKTWYVALGKAWMKGIEDEHFMKLHIRSNRVKILNGQSLTSRLVASLAA